MLQGQEDSQKKIIGKRVERPEPVQVENIVAKVITEPVRLRDLSKMGKGGKNDLEIFDSED